MRVNSVFSAPRARGRKGRKGQAPHIEHNSPEKSGARARNGLAPA